MEARWEAVAALEFSAEEQDKGLPGRKGTSNSMWFAQKFPAEWLGVQLSSKQWFVSGEPPLLARTHPGSPHFPQQLQLRVGIGSSGEAAGFSRAPGTPGSPSHQSCIHN